MSHISGDHTSVDVIMGVVKLDLKKPLPSYENFALSMEHTKEYERTLQSIFSRAEEGYTDAYIYDYNLKKLNDPENSEKIEESEDAKDSKAIIRFFTNEENGFTYKKVGYFHCYDWYDPKEGTVAKKLQQVTERYQYERIVKVILKKRDTDKVRYLNPEQPVIVGIAKILKSVEERLKEDGFEISYNGGRTIIRLNDDIHTDKNVDDSIN